MHQLESTMYSLIILLTKSALDYDRLQTPIDPYKSPPSSRVGEGLGSQQALTCAQGALGGLLPGFCLRLRSPRHPCPQ